MLGRLTIRVKVLIPIPTEVILVVVAGMVGIWVDVVVDIVVVVVDKSGVGPIARTGMVQLLRKGMRWENIVRPHGLGGVSAKDIRKETAGPAALVGRIAEDAGAVELGIGVDAALPQLETHSPDFGRDRQNE